MVGLLPAFLVFYGFFVVFYSSAVDFLTTYLPERLVKSAIPFSAAGWLVVSLLSRSARPVVDSLLWAAASFALGYVLYRLRLWASGDMWLLSAASASLSPAFPNFWLFFPYMLIWAGILGTFYYCFFFVKHRLYEKHLPVALTFLAILGYSLLSPLERFPWAISALIFFVLFTRKDVEALFIREKPVRELEEDDWVLDDLKLGDRVIKAPAVLTKKEEALARRLGRGKVRVKGGVPMTPAFSLALASLLFTL